uniref:interferon regulatory factor 8-like isoform X3 n=1 Tax=Pristiophorus japonicus TaxID=55135 RepID=UPI00398E8D4A
MRGRVRCTRKLKQWMFEQVDSGLYPGLVWEDRKLGMFRIPWKHAGKQDYRHDEDAAIFKAWATFKGKYKEGDKVDPATWKTRLRCALNKSCEFEEVPQRSQLDISEPYKVYKIVDDNTAKRKLSSSLDLGSVKVNRNETVRQLKSATDSPTPEEQELRGSPAPDSQQAESDSSSDPSSGSEMSVQEEDSGESTSLEWSATPAVEVENNCTNDVTLLMLPSLPETDPNAMCISFHYGGVEVSRTVTRHGCKISSAPPPSRGETSFGVQTMEKLCFPPTDSVGVPEKRQATEELLTFLERGVMLDSNANGIFVQRLCQGRVFWSGPCSPLPDRTNKLEREKVAKLFDRAKFERELQLYQAECGDQPQYQVTLCFGEELTATDSTAEKLITVQIHQVAAKQLLDRELDIRTSFLLLNDNFSDRFTNAIREVTSSLYGIS